MTITSDENQIIFHGALYYSDRSASAFTPFWSLVEIGRESGMKKMFNLQFQLYFKFLIWNFTYSKELILKFQLLLYYFQ